MIRNVLYFVLYLQIVHITNWESGCNFCYISIFIYKLTPFFNRLFVMSLFAFIILQCLLITNMVDIFEIRLDLVLVSALWFFIIIIKFQGLFCVIFRFDKKMRIHSHLAYTSIILLGSKRSDDNINLSLIWESMINWFSTN